MVENIVAPQISIIMPVYNGGPYLREAIESILIQTFSDFEFIIIDDVSTDNSVDTIRSFTDERIRFVLKEENGGLIDSLNMGIEMAKGTYIARMDADDISYKDRLEKQLDYMELHSDILVLGTRYKVMGTDRISVTTPIDYDQVKLFTLTQCPLAHPTAFIRADVFDKHNLRYNKEALYVEDYELWSRVIEIGKIENLPDVLLEYRRHEEQVSTKHLKKQAEAVNAVRLAQLKKIIDFSSKQYTEEFAVKIIQKYPVGVNSDGMVSVGAFIEDLWKANEAKKIYDQKLFKEFLNEIWSFYLAKLSGYRFKNFKPIWADAYGLKSKSAGFALKYFAGSVWGLRWELSQQ